MLWYHSRYSVLLIIVYFLCTWTVATAQHDWNRDHAGDRNGYDFDQRDIYKLGEFNDPCRSKKDCRQFGYVCRDNRTCQCDFMYVPDSMKRSCVGGVNQRCIYDEHCIEGAFCMNQAICKCKNSSPIELENGLVCAGADINHIVSKFLYLVTYLLGTIIGVQFNAL